MAAAKTDSFYGLIKEFSIQIPNLQRAYAQGRNTQRITGIRNTFIDDIYEALDSDNKHLSLDTIYGETKDKVFKPLDGQQRLTTLFLLHVYIGRNSGNDIGILKEKDNNKSRFTYSTRTASEDFCNYLVNGNFTFPTTVKDEKEEKAPAKNVIQNFFRNSMDFQWDWKFDPTIQSMLNMLDTIHEKFKFSGSDEDKERFKKYWNNLTGENRITFIWQPLKDTIPADDLYIRMNARGLALTDFENFKASFYSFLNKGDNEELKKAVKDLKERIDNEWTNDLWKYVKDQNQPAKRNSIASDVDKKLLLIFHMCILFELLKEKCGRGKDGLIHKFIQDNPCFDTLELMKNQYFTDENDKLRDKISNLIKSINALMKRLSDEFMKKDSNNLLKDFLASAGVKGKNNKISNSSVIKFYVRYFMFPDEGEASVINNQAYDIFDNLITYSYISEYGIFETAMDSLFKLQDKTAKDILDSLKKYDSFELQGFANNQLFEEHLKLKFISAKPEWKESFRKAETDKFFKGQYLFLFECLLSDNKPAYQEKMAALETIDPCNDDNITKFDRYRTDFLDLYKDKDKDCNLLRRALLLKGLQKWENEKYPVYPFSPDYQGDNKNPGSMILYGTEGDKMNWKRVLRLDLTSNYARNDKFQYRSWIGWILQQIGNDDNTLSAEERVKRLISDTTPTPSQIEDDSQKNLFNLLLRWSKEEDWSNFNHSAARIGENNEVFLLSGDGARMDKSYQELHLMLLSKEIKKNYDIEKYDYHGYLILKDKKTSREFYLRFITDHIEAGLKTNPDNEKVIWREISKYEYTADADNSGILEDIDKFLADKEPRLANEDSQESKQNT